MIASKDSTMDTLCGTMCTSGRGEDSGVDVSVLPTDTCTDDCNLAALVCLQGYVYGADAQAQLLVLRMEISTVVTVG